MATADHPPIARSPTLGEVLSPAIPVHRVLLHPTPGTATEADAIALHDHGDRLCELIDGILVEKTMGANESSLAARLIYLLMCFTEPRQLGSVLAPACMIRLTPGQVRMPDVAYYARERLPGGVIPDLAILDIIPDLAVEILSPSNTKREMSRKLREYFAAGVALVWYADPRKREVIVYEAADRPIVLDHAATLDGGAVLPGFALLVGDWLR